jgi:phosphatidylglycerol:prolipoprotein diacylglycerol transferase
VNDPAALLPSDEPGHAGAVATPRFFPNHVVVWRGARRRVVWFGVFAGSAVAVGVASVAAWLAGAGIAPGAVLPVLFGALVPGIVIGSRGWAVAVDLRTRPLREALSRTGFAFQGGLLGVAMMLPLAAALAGVHPLVLTDVCALALPAAHAVGRLGCLTYGCCYGRPTDAPWAMRYRCHEAKAVWEGGFHDIALHPTPLYQVAGCLLHAAFLAALTTVPGPVGVVTGTYLVVGATGRWVLEHFRSSTVRPTPFQRFALLQAAVGLLVLGTSALLVGSPIVPMAPWSNGPAPWADALAGGAWVWAVLAGVGVAGPLAIQGRAPGVFR